MNPKDADVDIYALGPLSASVCSRLGPEETVERVNQLLGSEDCRYVLDPDPTFRTGQPNPCVCEQDDTRKHYLFA